MSRFNPTSVAKRNKLEYIGDVNIEYGGTWYDMSTFNRGYVDAVRVTDLDSATGFDGAIMVEDVTVSGTLDKKRVKEALATCGMDVHSDAWHKMSTEGKRVMIADSLLWYGYCDTEPAQVLQPDRTQPDKFDGWQAERMSWTNIFKMLRRKLCNL